MFDVLRRTKITSKINEEGIDKTEKVLSRHHYV